VFFQILDCSVVSRNSQDTCKRCCS
jgi:hypothetical protein